MNEYKTYLDRARSKKTGLDEKNIYCLAFRFIWLDFHSGKITENQKDIYRNLLLLDYFLEFYRDKHTIPPYYYEPIYA